jgi:hypothetical protein
VKRFRWAYGSAAILAVLAVTLLVPAAPAQANVVTTFTNLNSKMCLGVLRGDMTNGTPVVQWPCIGHPDQTWVVDSLDGGWTTIRNSVNQNKCLGVWAGGTADGSNLVIWDCDGTPNQKWLLSSTINAEDSNGNLYRWWNGCYALINYGAGNPPGTTGINELNNFFPRVVGVWGGQTAPGIQTVIWTATNAPDQWWC